MGNHQKLERFNQLSFMLNSRVDHTKSDING